MTSLKRLTEDQARDLLEAMRWPNGPACPHCGSRKVGRATGKKCRAGLFNCLDCVKQFTATVGTVLESSHLPIHFWMYAIHAISASKKGVSAKQLQRELSELYDDGRKVSYRTAWFLCHRIREAMKSDEGILGGPGSHVEADETFVGGKPRPGAPHNPDRKTPVLALVERSGRAYARVVADISGDTLGPIVRSKIDLRSTLQTDSLTSYNYSGSKFAGHLKVSHSTGEYWRNDGACTNTVESFFALLKRGVYGSFHSVSRKHLNRYCDEFCFRWNHRKVSDSERALALLGQVSGKRLMYREPGSNTGPNRSRPSYTV